MFSIIPDRVGVVKPICTAIASLSVFSTFYFLRAILNELKETIKILGNTLQYKELTNDESKGLLKIISDYSYALGILDQYDYQTLKIENTSGKEIYQLTYEEAIKQIKIVKENYGNSDLFGNEKDESFKSSMFNIHNLSNFRRS